MQRVVRLFKAFRVVKGDEWLQVVTFELAVEDCVGLRALLQLFRVVFLRLFSLWFLHEFPFFLLLCPYQRMRYTQVMYQWQPLSFVMHMVGYVGRVRILEVSPYVLMIEH